jgi:two-component system heavy metal sensor histidine kinase CusS
MSWKNDDKHLAARVARFLALFFSSITARLTIVYIISTTILLVLTVGFLYWMIATSLERESIKFLADNVHVLRSIFRDNLSDSELLHREVHEEGPAHQFFKFYVRVLDGKLPLIETPGMSDLSPVPIPFPPPSRTIETNSEAIFWRTAQGKPLLLMSAWAPLGKKEGTQYLLHLALDVSHTEAILADYRKKIIAGVLFVVVLSAGAGVIAVRKGLRPLREIADTVRRITATQLDERIGARRWPTELSALAIAFDGMLDRLEGSFVRLSRFSADLAHELRTPINNLMGEAEVALTRARTTDEYQHVLESNIEEYRKLTRLIDNLLFLARAEESRMTVVKTLFRASDEIEIVRQYYEVLADEQGIEVTCSGDAPVRADVSLFHRAISNLISNSLKYTPPGGRILLEVRQSVDRSFTEIIVSDTGVGIASEHLPHIFNRFYRIHSSRTLHPEGTGLGLAIVKSIMDLHGATISVQSELKMGTTFLLRFPLA